MALQGQTSPSQDGFIQLPLLCCFEFPSLFCKGMWILRLLSEAPVFLPPSLLLPSCTPCSFLVIRLLMKNELCEKANHIGDHDRIEWVPPSCPGVQRRRRFLLSAGRRQPRWPQHHQQDTEEPPWGVGKCGAAHPGRARIRVT